MRSQSQTLTEDAALVKICRLAKEKNAVLLDEFLRTQKVLIDIHQGKNVPISVLAQAGDTGSVNFLIQHFGASRNSAVHGYALGGHVAQVDVLIQQGASRDRAVAGYARGGHVAQADALMQQGASRDWAVRGYARDGHVAQADALIQQGASRDWVVAGYALGGHVVQVDVMIQQGASRDWAVAVYAQGSYEAEVDALIRQGASRDWAVAGYALGGHVAQVNALIRQDASRDWAVNGFAQGGHVAQVDEMIRQGASRDWAVDGFAQGGHLRLENLLYLMTLTGDQELRSLLATKQCENDPAINVDVMVNKANKISRIMQEYELGFAEARALTIPGARMWLLQGQQLVREGKLVSDIYWNIGSKLMGGLTIEQTQRVFAVVHGHLLQDIKKVLTPSWFGSFFKSQQQTDRLITEASQRVEQRKFIP